MIYFHLIYHHLRLQVQMGDPTLTLEASFSCTKWVIQAAELGGKNTTQAEQGLPYYGKVLLL